MQRTFRRSAATVLLAAAALIATAAHAGHAWGSYHWARTSNPFALTFADNLTQVSWKNALSIAASDWSESTLLEVAVTQGSTNPKNCRPTAGRGDVCNSKYGNTGWLGVAQIWAGGSHITQGIVKLNDTYFNTATYNTADWRQLVTCQEVGHIFGLGHQDENFSNGNLNTCMDYTNSPASNTQPNAHDHQQLATIYSHLDNTTTIQSTVPMPAAMLGRDFDRQSSWGQLMKRSRDGARETYERHFGNGFRIITHVFWALEEGGPAHRQQRANEE